MKKQPLRHEEGYVLVITLFMLVALTVIGMAAITISSLDVEMAGNIRTRTACFRAADSGTQAVMAAVANGGLVPGSNPPPVSGTLPDGYSFITGHYDQVTASPITAVTGPSGGVSAYKMLAGWNLTNRIGFLFGGIYKTDVKTTDPNGNCQQELEVEFSVGTN